MAGINERTFIMIKPDGVQRRLVGEVISRFQRRGLKLVGLKQLVATEDHLRAHYAQHEGKPFLGGLLAYVGSGPVVAMVWQGMNSIQVGRTLVGATRPKESAPGTIRGDFCLDVGRNLIHGSDSQEAAQKEISHWFAEGELFDWEDCSQGWIYEQFNQDALGFVERTVKGNLKHFFGELRIGRDLRVVFEELVNGIFCSQDDTAENSD